MLRQKLVLLTLLSLTALCTLPNKAMSATAVIDSFTVTHTNGGGDPEADMTLPIHSSCRTLGPAGSDFCQVTVTFSFSTSGLYGAWSIDGGNPSGHVAGSNGCAATTVSGDGTRPHAGAAGSTSYTASACVYEMINGGQHNIVNATPVEKSCS